MADGVDDGGRRPAGGDGAEVVREREDGPVVGDGAEVGVFGVRERAVVDELRADDDVLSGLVGQAVGLCARVRCCRVGALLCTYVEGAVVRGALCVAVREPGMLNDGW